MAKELVMPQMGYDMQQGTVVRWIKKEGDEVVRGEPVAEIETDKAVVEMESIGGGVLRKIVAPEGTVAQVGEVIAIIGEPGEDISSLEAKGPEARGKDIPRSQSRGRPRQSTGCPATACSGPAPSGPRRRDQGLARRKTPGPGAWRRPRPGDRHRTRRAHRP